jgi:hypothetical protein
MDKAEAAKMAAAAGKVRPGPVVISSPKVVINYLCVWLCAD